MKRKVLLLSLALMMCAVGIVSAATKWGTFEGYTIVRLIINGDVVTPKDTPPVILKDRTMVPISMLEDAGLDVTWDPDTYSVNVKASNSDPYFDPSTFASNIISFGGGGVTLLNIDNDLTAITYFEQQDDFDKDWDNLTSIFSKLVEYNAIYSRIVYTVDYQTQGTIEIKTQDYKEFLQGKINDDQLNKLWILSGPMFEQTGSTSQNDGGTVYPTEKSYPQLYSNDQKTFLGKLTTNKYDTDSIFNEYGTYGSKYNSKSIWNEYGDYGSKYSSTSAFNELASEPPVIILDNKIIGYVTVNTTIANGILPGQLHKFLEDAGY